MTESTLFWRETKTKHDAYTLYDEIKKAVEKEDFKLIIDFRVDLSWTFAQELMELLVLGAIDYDKIKEKVRLKGFSTLDQYSWNNMTSAKVNAEHAKNYRNTCYGFGCMDGW